MGAGTNFSLFEGGRLRITNEPVRLLIRLAFRLQDSQIVGSPAWIETDRYDIEVGCHFLPGNHWCPWGSRMVREAQSAQELVQAGA
jgi:hypothetical protein